MTTVITRVFENEASALKAVEKLEFRRIPSRASNVFTAPADGDVDALKAQMARAKVHETAVDTYAQHVMAGRALLVVRTTYKPLTAATIARQVLAKRETIDVGDVVNDYYMADGPEPAKSVMKEHPLFLTARIDKSKYDGRPVSQGLNIPLLRQHRTRNSAISGGGFKSRAFWPMPLLSKKERSLSVISGGRHMSRAFWPGSLISRKKRNSSVIRGGGPTLSRILGWPTVS